MHVRNVGMLEYWECWGCGSDRMGVGVFGIFELRTGVL